MTLTAATSSDHTVTYIDATHAQLTWIALPQSTWVNISRYPPEQITYVGALTPGITNTLTLYGAYPQSYIVQEYQLVGNQLQLTRLWNSTTIPTGTIELTPTMTPEPTVMPTLTPIKQQMYIRQYIPNVTR